MDSAAAIFTSPAFWLGMLILVVMFFLGYGVIAWTRRWMQENRSEERNMEEELEHYRELRDSGEISEEEFQHISDMLYRPDASPSAGDDSSDPPDAANDEREPVDP